MTPTSPSLGTLPPRRIDIAEYLRAAARFDIDPDTAAAAAANLAAGKVVMLVVSGKLASGKDTVAPAVLDALRVTRREHQYYALPLKAELDAIIATMRAVWLRELPAEVNARFRGRLAQLLAEQFAMPVEQAAVFTGRLFDQVRSVPAIHSRSRTKVVRHALQFLGTEVRRTQDQDYWVKRALRAAVEALAAGTSVFFTDARFPNEIDAAAPLGAVTVRLDISARTQRERLLARDGIVADPAALNHTSETALDDYTAFGLRINNDGSLAQALTAILVALRDDTTVTAAAA